jgi:predicted nuclease of predicted toxin-antitoxin system
MRFLVDADLPRSAADVIRRAGHEATDVRDVGRRKADDEEIAAYAMRERICLVTGDFDFADIRNYPPDRYCGIVVLELPRNATASFINELLGEFLADADIVHALPGKLAIVAPGRVRIR